MSTGDSAEHPDTSYASPRHRNDPRQRVDAEEISPTKDRAAKANRVRNPERFSCVCDAPWCNAEGKLATSAAFSVPTNPLRAALFVNLLRASDSSEARAAQVEQIAGVTRRKRYVRKSHFSSADIKVNEHRDSLMRAAVPKLEKQVAAIIPPPSPSPTALATPPTPPTPSPPQELLLDAPKQRDDESDDEYIARVVRKCGTLIAKLKEDSEQTDDLRKQRNDLQQRLKGMCSDSLMSWGKLQSDDSLRRCCSEFTPFETGIPLISCLLLMITICP